MNNTAYFSFLLAIHFYSLFSPEIFYSFFGPEIFYSFFGPEIFFILSLVLKIFIRSLVRKFLYLFFGPEILRIIFPSHKATILSSLPLRCHVPTAYIYIYISRGLAVYVTTSYWYLQITSQFHYQTKTQNNISNGSDSPQTSALCQNIRCLMTNWPCFLIKSNFITSLFNGTTAVSYIQFSNTEINC